MTTLIEVKHLSKSYQKKQVIHDISFSINEGEILCLLGPNGAAKSTTINILCGLLNYDQGEIFYRNEKIERNLLYYKKYLGIVPQELALYEDLTAEKISSFLLLYMV
ncbi:ATP-binding cassette domain-containing protein [Enterococcus termitis]